MRILGLLLLLSCWKGNKDSLVLSGRVGDDDPGGQAPVCPWVEVREVRAESDTVWIDDRSYDVSDGLGEGAFLRLLEACQRPDALAAYQAWRAAELAEAEVAEADAPRGLRLAPASSEVDIKPLHERQPEDAWATQGRPDTSVRTVSPELQAARDAFAAALRGP